MTHTVAWAKIMYSETSDFCGAAGIQNNHYKGDAGCITEELNFELSQGWGLAGLLVFLFLIQIGIGILERTRVVGGFLERFFLL